MSTVGVTCCSLGAAGLGCGCAEANIASASEEKISLLAGLRTGSWLDAQVFPPLSWIVPDLVPEGMSLLVGGPKIGKSWLSLDIALSVASGGRALGTIPTGPARPVLLLALEDGDRRLQDRARSLLFKDKIPPLLNYMTRIEPNFVVPTIEEWLSTIDPDAEPLVILDTLGKVMPAAAAGESTYQRDYRVAGRLKQVCDQRPGMALVVLHHDRKAQAEHGDFVDSVSGTNGIAGAADTIIIIARPRTETRGLLKVTGRDVNEREYAVEIDGGQWRLVGQSLDEAATAADTVKATANLADRSAEIVRLVAQRPAGVRASDIASELDMAPNDARRYLDRLHKAGRLDRPARGLYTPVLSVLSVLSPGDDHPPQDTQDTQDRGVSKCEVCGFPLNPGLAASGETTHPNCEEPA